MTHFSFRWYLLFDFLEKDNALYLGLTESERRDHIDFLCDKIMQKAYNA